MKPAFLPCNCMHVPTVPIHRTLCPLHAQRTQHPRQQPATTLARSCKLHPAPPCHLHSQSNCGGCAALAVSHDSSLLASLSSSDRSLKVFDVATYDMIGMLRLPFAPACAEWIDQVLRCARLACLMQGQPAVFVPGKQSWRPGPGGF